MKKYSTSVILFVLSTLTLAGCGGGDDMTASMNSSASDAQIVKLSMSTFIDSMTERAI